MPKLNTIENIRFGSGVCVCFLYIRISLSLSRCMRVRGENMAQLMLFSLCTYTWKFAPIYCRVHYRSFVILYVWLEVVDFTKDKQHKEKKQFK